MNKEEKELIIEALSHRAQLDGLVGDAFDFSKRQFLGFGVPVVGGQVDVAVAAVVVTAGGQLQVKGIQRPGMGRFLLPQAEVLDLDFIDFAHLFYL